MALTLPDLLAAQVEGREKLTNAGEFVPQWKSLRNYLEQRCWEEKPPEAKRYYPTEVVL